MGSPIVANLFMEWFEDKFIESFPYEITIRRRYVHDTIVALCDSLIENPTSHINCIELALHSICEEETNNSIPMLDTLITRTEDGQLTFTVYRKSTNTDQYI